MCVWVCVCACACLCKMLEIMYRLPKMRKKPIGARFTVISKNCSAKALLFNMQNFENDFKRIWLKRSNRDEMGWENLPAAELQEEDWIKDAT